MTLLKDILQWTETLPYWQRDATRRLLQKEQGLSEEDYIELYTLLKAEHGLLKSDDLEAVPLGPDHLPTEAKPDETVILKAMHELENVNRITPNQTLTFSETGITVIYGGNSSGKSGYSRVLKRACRARDQSEQVRPNANDPAAANVIPTAKLDIEVAGVTQQICWSRDEVPPEKLSTISVFDSRCARSYLTAEHDVAYLPYGLDIIENLANQVLPEIKRRLDDEIARIDISAKPFEHLHGDSKVGKQIEGLTVKSDPEAIKALGTLTAEDTKRLTELNKALAETDPVAKAKELRLSASRLKALGDRVIKSLAWVSDEAVEKLQKLDEAKRAAEEAEKKAAEALQAGETLLAGTGEQVWKALFDAAKKYSIEVAYPGHDFPHTDEDAVCPLCQEPLEESTGLRLKRFEQYVRDDVAKTAKEQRRKLEMAKEKIEGAVLQIGLDSAITEEILLLDEALPSVAAAFEASLKERKDMMLTSLRTHDWSAITEVTENPRKWIRGLAAKQLLSARIFLRAADEARKKKLADERDELAARQNLTKSLDAVLALLQRMKDKALLEKCYRQLKPRPISDKSKELASKVVTNELKKGLDREFAALGVGHIKTELKERIDHGRILHQLVLDLPTKYKIDDILSEGEQGAIAIGAFLAELSFANNSCGIVFDDPVSSLDHWRRRDVARRLVEEASRRQVIIFTHDTSFLGQLCDEIDASGAPHSMMFLEWIGDCPGFVCGGLPWDHQGYKARLDSLEKEQRKIAKSWPPYPGEEESNQMRHQYDRLRATLERVIQDVVFNGVVKRYRDWIRVDSLAEVVGFDQSEYEAIDKLHKHCCNVITAHDAASDKAASVPKAMDLGSDIEILKRLVDRIKQRRKKRH